MDYNLLYELLSILWRVITVIGDVVLLFEKHFPTVFWFTTTIIVIVVVWFLFIGYHMYIIKKDFKKTEKEMKERRNCCILKFYK